jgi:hypothetical protein
LLFPDSWLGLTISSVKIFLYSYLTIFPELMKNVEFGKLLCNSMPIPIGSHILNASAKGIKRSWGTGYGDNSNCNSSHTEDRDWGDQDSRPFQAKSSREPI